TVRVRCGLIDMSFVCLFFFQAEDGIRDWSVTGVQTCALPIYARVEVHRTPVALGPFLDDLRTTERHPAAPGVHVMWEVPAHLPVASTDAGKLAVLLNNLVNNALKFTRAGHVHVGSRMLPGEGIVEF